MITMKWKWRVIDAPRAFLQSKPSDRLSVLKQTADVLKSDKNARRELKRAICGLSGAGEQWYQTSKEFVGELVGFAMTDNRSAFCLPDIAPCGVHDEEQRQNDPEMGNCEVIGNELGRPSLATKGDRTNALVGRNNGIDLARFDDFFTAGSNAFRGGITREVCKRFACGQHEYDATTFTGWDIEASSEDGGVITLRKKDYESNTDHIIATPQRRKGIDDTSSNEGMRQFQTQMGRLIWMSTMSRPYPAYRISITSATCLSEPDDENIRSKNSEEVPKWLLNQIEAGRGKLSWLNETMQKHEEKGAVCENMANQAQPTTRITVRSILYVDIFIRYPQWRNCHLRFADIARCGGPAKLEDVIICGSSLYSAAR